MELAIVVVRTEMERVGTAFGTGGTESVARRGVSVVGLPAPLIAGKSDALEDGVVVVVSPAVGIYSAAETEGTPGYTVAVVAAAVDNRLDFGPYI
jgi:hypothetical protein